MSLVLVLQARGRCTAAALAETLGVSERTVYRDLDALAAAGVPVYGVAGPGGGFALVDGYRTSLTGLTPAEADALLLVDASGLLAALGMKEQHLAGRLKLIAALRPALSERAGSISGWVHLDLSDWFEEASVPAALPCLASAVVTERKVRFRYGGTDEDERLVDPLGLVLKGRSWYLVALRQERLLTYAVSRVRDPVVTGEETVRPAGFELDRAWGELVTAFETGLPSVEVRVRVAPEAASSLRRALEPRARGDVDWAGVAAAHTWSECTVRFEHLDHAASALLPLGASVEVLAPGPLRDALAREAGALAALYGARAVRTQRFDTVSR